MAKSQYDWVYDAYTKWLAEKTKANSDELWMACWHQMRMVVLRQARKLQHAIEYDELKGIITDSTINVVGYFETHDGVSYQKLYNIFKNQNKKAFRSYNYSIKKYKRAQKEAVDEIHYSR